MRCRQMERFMDRFIEHDLPETVYQRMQLHLKSCGRCRELKERALSLREQYRSTAQAEGPKRDLWPGIQERISMSPGPKPGIIIPRFAFAAVVFMAAAGLFFGIFFTLRTNPSRGGTEMVNEFRDLEARYQKVKSFSFESARRLDTGIPPETLLRIEADLNELDKIAEDIFEALEGYTGSGDYYILVFDHYRKKFQILKQLRNLSTAGADSAAGWKMKNL